MVDNAENPISELTKRYGVDVSEVTESNPKLTPRLAILDEKGTTEQHVSEAGANYTYFQIDFYEAENLCASRTFAMITPGNRTELAYWTKKAPLQRLDIHKGKGRLIIGDPSEGKTECLSLNNQDVRQVTLPPGCFYTIQADTEGVEPLIISSYYEPPPDWDKLEISLNQGENSVSAPEGEIQAPSDFLTTCEIY